MLCILLVHSVSHLMITLFVSLVSSSVPSSSQFPLSPLPYCAAAPVSAGTTGDLVYLLSSWESKLSQSHAAKFMALPKPFRSLFVSFFPQTLWPPASITWGICTAKGRWPNGAHQSPIKHAEVAHMEFLLSGAGDGEWAEVPAVLICTVAETPVPNKTSVSA